MSPVAAPEAPQELGSFPWHGRNGGSQQGNVEQVATVLDFMFENFNVYRDILFGSGASGASGGSWFHDAVFFPREGANYPSFFYLGCGAAGMREGYFTYNSAKAVSENADAIARSELKYTIGTEDFLFPNATVSAPTYTALGFSVRTEFMEGVGHCQFDLSTKTAAYWSEKLDELSALFAAPARLSARVRVTPNGDAEIQWNAQIGKNYRIEYSDGLGQGSGWNTLVVAPGSNTATDKDAVNSTSTDGRYYRVVEMN